MTNDVHEAAQRLLTTINGIHVGVQVQPGVIISTADVIRVCEWARALGDGELASTPEKLEAMGFFVTSRRSGEWCATKDIKKQRIFVYDSGVWYLDGGALPLMPTLGQLRLLLAALSAGEGK